MANHSASDKEKKQSQEQPKVWKMDEPNSEPAHHGPQNPPRKWYKKIRWNEVLETVAVLVAIAVCYIYWEQLQVMSRQLMEIQGTSSQTSQLIVNAARQAGGTHDLAVAASDQAKSMGKQLDLQREIARLEHGARVRLRSIAVYHDAGKILADIEMENDGKATAVQISIARKIEFRKSPPTVDLAKFKFFEPVEPSRLHPLPDNGQAPEIGRVWHLQTPIPRGYSAYKSGAEDIYIWGVISYSDFTRQDVRDSFCEQISAKQVFNSPLGILPGRGVYLPPKDCPTSTARNQQAPANQPQRSNPE